MMYLLDLLKEILGNKTFLRIEISNTVSWLLTSEKYAILEISIASQHPPLVDVDIQGPEFSWTVPVNENSNFKYVIQFILETIRSWKNNGIYFPPMHGLDAVEVHDGMHSSECNTVVIW